MSVHTDEAVPSTPVSSEQVLEQVHRVLQSETFKASGILRQLLDYLAACKLDGRSESVKVKEIARAVFGRPENFDSQSDSVVRVHTGRLRSKLAEYYIDEGAQDELILAIPKGGYELAWHLRVPAASHPVPAPAELSTLAIAHAPDVLVRPSPALWNWRHLAVALVLVAATAAATWSVAQRHSARLHPANTPSLATFWGAFVTPAEPPLLVFSNFHMAGNLDTSLHGFGSEPGDRESGEIDTYTTTGEVMGVFEVTRALAAFGQTARAKHGQLLTWDDAKDSNLIFVGGPLANTPLRGLSAMHDLAFKKGLPGSTPHAASLVNLHPRRGEQAFYTGPETRPFLFDYGVIALKPMFNHERRTLILAGITEFGTQGAADFVTQEQHVGELLAKLHVRAGQAVPNFEALLRVKIQGDVPVEYELEFVHAVN